MNNEQIHMGEQEQIKVREKFSRNTRKKQDCITEVNFLLLLFFFVVCCVVGEREQYLITFHSMLINENENEYKKVFKLQ